ncbi:hypothetical protein BKA65DRAFT_411243 [Rhexocercosporidium sp. MPI-PUGE-AT-0058]|nr:hypothetical protein BKA65DRAFT_411243 [Rhexocercosporidium sp. MPI-PUGE-AT-0058]
MSSRNTAGVVHQQDLQFATATVKEALIFSAVLRQPKTTPYAEKITYVEEVISLIGMEAHADSVIGTSGENLNTEQMKRLAIGIELAARPTSLLLLHQPLASASCKTMTSYFERQGARPCNADENPAEWMLEITGSTADSEGQQDWSEIWKISPERQAMKSKLGHLKGKLSGRLDLVTSLSTSDIVQESAAALDAIELQRESELGVFHFIFSVYLTPVQALSTGIFSWKTYKYRYILQNPMLVGVGSQIMLLYIVQHTYSKE